MKQIPEHILNRKAPRTLALVDPKAMRFLNQGLLPTLNLVEWLAIDNEKLVNATLKACVSKSVYKALQELVLTKSSIGVNALHREIGKLIGLQSEDKCLIACADSRSDVVRGWAAWAYATRYRGDIERSLTGIVSFASDNHFSVRELAWMAVRDTLAQDIESALFHLFPFTKSKDENLRRFASEATRPCGVWCKHIKELKENPVPAEGLLSNLCNDPSRYVQNSVGNWLNDAGKTRPDWVLHVCRKWEQNYPDSDHTAYIVKRAMRNL